MVIESIRSKKEADSEDFLDLQAICQHGFLGDAEHKEEYKKYSDYIKETALRQVTKQEKKAKIWREIYWSTVKLEAYWFFESYLIYMEHKRPYEKRFYEPRAKTLKTVVDDLQRLEDSKTQRMYTLSLPSRVGKALADDTPILTTEGWKNHGDLVVGDKLFNSKGETVKVTYVHPKCTSTHIVTFSDGEEIECHENHEWIVYDRFKQKTVTIETREMLNTYLSNECGKKRPRYCINLRQPIIGEYKKLPVDPYTLGAWLGDGTNIAPNITNDKRDLAIVEKIVRNGYEISNTYIHKTYGTYRTSFSGLRKDLQKIGMCLSHKTTVKHIPEEYLTASIEQRLELLAGLLDTDGTFKEKENRYSFSTTELQLAKGIKTLVDTFGWRASVMEYSPRVSSSGIIGRKTVYRVDFNPTFEIPCVLERKKIHKFSKQKRVTVANIRESEKKTQGNCITVEGGEYLAGRSLKPTHNSTIMVFFLSWVVLRHPESHNAMGTHSGFLADHFYKECLDIFTTPEYCFEELYVYIHPDKKFIEDKSAEKMTISFVNKGDFPTCTFRGIDGTWTGAVDISSDGYLLVDDLVRDRTHSLSPKRMNDTFSEYLNKMVDRKNDGAKEIMIGTLWNVLDPIKRLEEMYGDDDRYVFRRIPALNENGESNFDYEIKGFSTEYYQDMKDKLIRAGNEAEWMAKFQQQPYVREGILFPLDELGYFNGILPQGHKYRFAVNCDVAFGGGDSVSMPIGIHDKTDDIIYIVDWYFNNGGVTVTVPGVVDMIIKHGIKNVTFEANAGGQLYASKIQEELKNRNYLCACDSVRAPNNASKEDKIKACEGVIRQKFRFLDSTKHNPEEYGEDIIIYERSPQYERALDEMGTYVTIGKNPKDDAADSISQIAERVFDTMQRRTVIMDCPF